MALAASAIAVSAAPGLSLKVSGAEAVDGVENFKVTTTVTNTGDETLKLINDPRGALNTLPANTFAITSDAGESPSFVGVKAKFVLDKVAKSENAGSFTVLAPGASFTLTHDREPPLLSCISNASADLSLFTVSAAYNFSAPGEGKYTVEASNLFHYVDPTTSEAVEIRADGETHVASLSGKLAATQPTLVKRESYVGCSSSRETAINSAASAAQTYAANAYSYVPP